MPSTRSIIRKACLSVMEDSQASPADRLKAITILLKLQASTKKQKPRGRPFQKRDSTKEAESKLQLERILSVVQ